MDTTPAPTLLTQSCVTLPPQLVLQEETKQIVAVNNRLHVRALCDSCSLSTSLLVQAAHVIACADLFEAEADQGGWLHPYRCPRRGREHAGLLGQTRATPLATRRPRRSSPPRCGVNWPMPSPSPSCSTLTSTAATSPGPSGSGGSSRPSPGPSSLPSGRRIVMYSPPCVLWDGGSFKGSICSGAGAGWALTRRLSLEWSSTQRCSKATARYVSAIS